MTILDFLRRVLAGPVSTPTSPASPSPDLAPALAAANARNADLSERLSDMAERLRSTTDAALRERESANTLREALGAAREAAAAAERGLQASQQALSARQVTLDTAQAEIAALLAKAEKADAVLAAVRAELDDARLSLTVYEREAQEMQTELEAATAELAAMVLPDAPASKTDSYPASVIVGIVQKVLGMTPLIWDNTYRVVSEDDVVRFWRERKTRGAWTSDVNDCDNFATDGFNDCLRWGSNCLILTGDAQGFGAHAWNAVVVRTSSGELDVVMFEPQSGVRAQPVMYAPSWCVADG